MRSKSTIISEKLENLILDINNPRFAELYSGSNKEEDLIEYLLYTEAAEDVAKAMVQVNEFYPDEPLWVLKDGNKYLIKDGNRRCAAVKSLQVPDKYQLGLKKFKLDKLPILIFEDENYLNQRIKEKHTSNLFRKWERIAKALEVYKLYSSGSSENSIIGDEVTSDPAALIKLASFYYEAVKIGKEDLKKLLRRGRGKTGGKTIVFERLFKYSKLCGYSFKNKPSYQINVLNKTKFSQYISAMTEYLEKEPTISHKTIDEEGESFLNKLEEFGFKKEILKTKKSKIKSREEENINNKQKRKESDDTSTNTFFPNFKKRGSIEYRPKYERKRIPSALVKLIKECYDLDSNNFPSAKITLTRVSLECTLKYIVENTSYDGKKNISESSFFRKAFPKKPDGASAGYVNFKELKLTFTKLIKSIGKKNAFISFDIDNIEQVIHNYDVGGIPSNAKGHCDNLVPLINFMLQEENDLLNSLDLTKL